jgi:Putative DNA-binding domain
MRSGVMTLAEIQDGFQQALLAASDGVLAGLADGAREPKEVLLGLYRDDYILRLIEYVQNDHELLRAYLGDDAFEEMARAYAAAYPSRYRNAKDFCVHIPQFLAEAEPYSGHPVLGDLAALEKSLNDAFYAKDEAVIGVAALAVFAPSDWGTLRFTPHPAALRLDLGTNAADIWSALKRGEEPPPAEARTRQRILVYRQDVPKFRVLSEEEAMLWDEAAGGVRFGVLCEMAATYGDPDEAAMRAAGYLQGWLGTGLLSGAALA